MKDTKETKKNEEVKKGKVLSGIVVSDKMKDTVVVEVKGYQKHPKYQKYIKTRKRYKVHDEGNIKKIGDEVKIKECRPLSKTKHFTLIQTSKVKGKE